MWKRWPWPLNLIVDSCFCVNRNQQIAERHSRLTLLRKYFIAWQVWVQSEQDRRELEQAQNNTRNKMMSLLEAAATGKLWNQEDAVSTKPTPRKPQTDRQSTADKIVRSSSDYHMLNKPNIQRLFLLLWSTVCLK